MRQPVSAVEKLVTINEIREVMARYARHADHKEFQDLAGLFTPDGTFMRIPVNVITESGKVITKS